MNKNFSYGLGWQPDLPDHRDKSFDRAAKKVEVADGKKSGGEKPSRLEGPPADPNHITTHKAWAASRKFSELMATKLAEAEKQEEAKIDTKAVSERYDRAFKSAFMLEGGNPVQLHLMGKSSGTRPKAKVGLSRNPGEPLLLDAPPEKPPFGRVDLRPFMSPIENQGTIGSCTAHAVIGLVEYLQIATQGQYVDGARLFLYKATRNLLEWPGDQGAYIRETIKAVRLFGICPERYLPYDTSRFDEEPSSFCYAFAANYKAVSYYRLSNLNEIKRSLAQGYPVAFGFTCFESLQLPGTAKTGIIPYPLAAERSVGGHAVLAVGYLDKEEDKNSDNPDGHLIIRNSWGMWGDKGYGYLPYDYVPGNPNNRRPLADDFWTMTRMEIPSLSDSQAPPFALGDDGGVQEGGGGGGGYQLSGHDSGVHGVGGVR